MPGELGQHRTYTSWPLTPCTAGMGQEEQQEALLPSQTPCQQGHPRAGQQHISNALERAVVAQGLGQHSGCAQPLVGERAQSEAAANAAPAPTSLQPREGCWGCFPAGSLPPMQGLLCSLPLCACVQPAKVKEW